MRASEDLGVPIRALPRDVVRAHLGASVGDDAVERALDARRSIERRAVIGGTASPAVRDQISALGARLESATRPGM
jgi:hypothetical protein